MIILAIAIFATIFILTPQGWKAKNLINPGLKVSSNKPLDNPTPSSIPTTKTYKFDATTDLKKELDGINPQVLDADFK